MNLKKKSWCFIFFYALEAMCSQNKYPLALLQMSKYFQKATLLKSYPTHFTLGAHNKNLQLMNVESKKLHDR